MVSLFSFFFVNENFYYISKIFGNFCLLSSFNFMFSVFNSIILSPNIKSPFVIAGNIATNFSPLLIVPIMIVIKNLQNLVVTFLSHFCHLMQVGLLGPILIIFFTVFKNFLQLFFVNFNVFNFGSNTSFNISRALSRKLRVLFFSLFLLYGLTMFISFPTFNY